MQHLTHSSHSWSNINFMNWSTVPSILRYINILNIHIMCTSVITSYSLYRAQKYDITFNRITLMVSPQYALVGNVKGYTMKMNESLNVLSSPMTITEHIPNARTASTINNWAKCATLMSTIGDYMTNSVLSNIYSLRCNILYIAILMEVWWP